nr:MAG TPA: hypothetical protein [Caudoviricetes sp.]
MSIDKHTIAIHKSHVKPSPIPSSRYPHRTPHAIIIIGKWTTFGLS